MPFQKTSCNYNNTLVCLEKAQQILSQMQLEKKTVVDMNSHINPIKLQEENEINNIRGILIDIMKQQKNRE